MNKHLPTSDATRTTLTHAIDRRKPATERYGVRRAIATAVLACVTLAWLSCMPRCAAAQTSEGPQAASTNDAPSVPSQAAVHSPGVVNLNTADAAELERLPRIGPARAQAILALRAKLKQFSRVEQLLQVKGIGRATFRKLRPLLALTGPTTLENKHTR